MKLVPLAHDAFLDLTKSRRLSELPRPKFDMQTEKLTPLGVESEHAEVEELVSVLLGPHDNLNEQETNLASQRRARYDGVIQHETALLTVIESKLYPTPTEQPFQINTGGLTALRSRTVLVRWHDLLDRWWNLTELGVLGPAEAGVLSDFFDNAEENFGDLLPYTDLERCGDNRARRVRRLRTILEKATGLPAEVRDALGHAGVRFPVDQVSAFDRASLYQDSSNIVLSVWPAELAPQYRSVYSDRRKVENLIALTADPTWQIRRNFHLSFWRASVPRRWYPKGNAPGPEYIRQWLEDFGLQHARRRPREDLRDHAFRSWLTERGYANSDEMDELDEWADKLPMDKFDVRPGIQITKSWPYDEALRLDSARLFTEHVRVALDALLIALKEPPLESLR
ncbi:hypothetical protein [Mycolicibacterium vaccae]|uniref:hypothetical protein n=1 Tax=Mycolicibacterium vaccae TaxID=1810 RepID=UPI003CFF99CA